MSDSIQISFCINDAFTFLDAPLQLNAKTDVMQRRIDPGMSMSCSINKQQGQVLTLTVVNVVSFSPSLSARA